MHAEIYGIEREHNSKKFEEVQKMGRLKSMMGITDRENTFTFMRWLKKGKTVLYAPDQDYGIKKSIEVNFFGVPAATVKAPLKIIEKTGCKTFFINSYYDKDILILDIEEIKIDKSSVENFNKQLSCHTSLASWRYLMFLNKKTRNDMLASDLTCNSFPTFSK